MRFLLLTAALILSACGTPCSRVASAEATADERGKGCNASRSSWSSAKVTQCESNLSSCSPNDTKQLDQYANCLNALPACNEGQRSSWELQRVACYAENVLFKLSGPCSQGL